MKTLYVSDLDGTLLRPEGVLSTKTINMINCLLDDGMLFTAATARSPIGIGLLNLEALHFRLPLILMNGVLLFDNTTRKILHSDIMSEQTVQRVLDICMRHGKSPFFYRIQNGDMIIEYQQTTTLAEQVFLEKRADRFPQAFRQISRYSAEGGGVYFSLQDTYERLNAIHRELEPMDEIRCAFYRDVYMDDNWYLEIYDAASGKDKGIERLATQWNVDRIVAFGDNLNDAAMLRMADCACVVENGMDAAKALADCIIGSNDADGVAEFLQNDFHIS